MDLGIYYTIQEHKFMLKVLTWTPVWISVWLSQLLFNFCNDETVPWGQMLFAILSLTLKVTRAAQNSE